MTCIVGLVEGDRIWMGGDSAVSAYTDLVVQASPKVFRNGPMIFGCCGSMRVRDVLHYGLEIPKHSRRLDVARYMCTEFTDAVREAMKKAGALQTFNAVDELPNTGFLVGYRGRLFSVDSDLQVGEAVDDFYAVGSGGAIAQGAMYVSQGVPARKRVLAALAASERYNTGVRRPFTVQVLGPES